MTKAVISSTTRGRTSVTVAAALVFAATTAGPFTSPATAKEPFTFSPADKATLHQNTKTQCEDLNSIYKGYRALARASATYLDIAAGFMGLANGVLELIYTLAPDDPAIKGVDCDTAVPNAIEAASDKIKYRDAVAERGLALSREFGGNNSALKPYKDFVTFFDENLLGSYGKYETEAIHSTLRKYFKTVYEADPVLKDRIDALKP